MDSGQRAGRKDIAIPKCAQLLFLSSPVLLQQAGGRGLPGFAIKKRERTKDIRPGLRYNITHITRGQHDAVEIFKPLGRRHRARPGPPSGLAAPLPCCVWQMWSPTVSRT